MTTRRGVLVLLGLGVTGDVVTTGGMDLKRDGAVEGIINGDVLRLYMPHSTGWRFELTVSGEEMSGVGTHRIGHPLVKPRRVE